MSDQQLEMLLVHPGGPYWAKKDEGAWTIPKGELGPGEDPLSAALRELHEETGVVARGAPLDLGTVRQAGGKSVHAFAVMGNVDPDTIHSNRFEMEWPPRTGKRQHFPEVDKAAWFSPSAARRKINSAQAAFIIALQYRLGMMDND